MTQRVMTLESDRLVNDVCERLAEAAPPGHQFDPAWYPMIQTVVVATMDVLLHRYGLGEIDATDEKGAD